MEIIFLGTSSAVHSKDRNHPSIALKAFGEVFLFDCGEATQKQILKTNISPMKISKIFLTHYHGDHIGLYNKILPEIPIYIGEFSKKSRPDLIKMNHVVFFKEWDYLVDYTYEILSELGVVDYFVEKVPALIDAVNKNNSYDYKKEDFAF